WPFNTGRVDPVSSVPTADSGGMALFNLLDLRIRICQLREIGRTGSGIKLGEQRVVERAGLELSHPAFGIVEIAKGDRLGRASRLAGGNDITIADTAAFFLGLDPGCRYP